MNKENKQLANAIKEGVIIALDITRNGTINFNNIWSYLNSLPTIRQGIDNLKQIGKEAPTITPHELNEIKAIYESIEIDRLAYTDQMLIKDKLYGEHCDLLIKLRTFN